MSSQSSRQYVGLLNVRPEFKPQIRHQNENMKIIRRRLSLIRFLAKTLRVNKIDMIKASQKSIENSSYSGLQQRSNIHIFRASNEDCRSLGFLGVAQVILQYIIHTYIIGHYNPSVSITIQLLIPLNLSTLILCISGWTYSLKSTPNYIFLRIFFMTIFFQFSADIQQKL